MKMKLRKGFTLVELLIVIVIIGVLAAAMLLASGAATASAEASNIVSNLRSLKSASLMFFSDNMDALMATPAPANISIGITGVPRESIAHLARYTDNPTSPIWGAYTFHMVQPAGGPGVPLTEFTWWISTAVGRADVGTRLQGRAESVGLFNDATANVPVTGNYVAPASGQSNRVFMLLRAPGIN